METPSNNPLLDKINNQYQSAPSDKTKKYINQFYANQELKLIDYQLVMFL